MLRKLNFKTLFCLFLLVLPLALSGVEIRSEQHEDIDSPRRNKLKFAAWNIRDMSNNSRNDEELEKIVLTLADYDFIAITEVNDTMVLDRAVAMLEDNYNRHYTYEFSPAVGREENGRIVDIEHYAFFYDKNVINEVVQKGRLYPDMDDGEDDFDRDPYWATFRAGKFDFSVIVVHLVPDNKLPKLQKEIRALKAVYMHVRQENNGEDDILLVGDFNRNTSDVYAFSGLMSDPLLPTMTALFHKKKHRSTINDKELYDNIFFECVNLTEYAEKCDVDKFDETDFGNDDKAANLAVSNHRPVWAYFYTDVDDSNVENVNSDAQSTDPDSQ